MGVDTHPPQDEALDEYNESGAVPYRVRRPEQVSRFSTAWNSPSPVWC